MAARSSMMAAKISRDPSIPLAGNSAGSSPRRPADARHHPQISPTRHTLGAPYELRSDPTGYPTLYTLSYATTTSTFLAGASQLDLLINQVKSLTWADRVNVVTHSKGGLVARQYLVSFPSGPTSLN